MLINQQSKMNHIALQSENNGQIVNWRSKKYKLSEFCLLYYGLSEKLLLKEFVNVHWQMVSEALGADASVGVGIKGNYLNDGFARIVWESSNGLLNYVENEEIQIKSRLSRVGLQTIHSAHEVNCAERKVSASLVSVFSSRTNESNAGSHNEEDVMSRAPYIGGQNVSLLSAGYSYDEKTSLGTSTEEVSVQNDEDLTWVKEDKRCVFSCEYTLRNLGDMDEVGLLYFDTYTDIFDKCEQIYFQQVIQSADGPGDWAGNSFVISRDIRFYGHANLTEVLQYSLHHLSNMEKDRIKMESSLYRRSNGEVIATLITVKECKNIEVTIPVYKDEAAMHLSPDVEDQVFDISGLEKNNDIEDEGVESRNTIHLESCGKDSDENIDTNSVGCTDIAIIGYTFRLPEANTREELWKLLKEGRCAVKKMPEGRWKWPDWIDFQKDHKGIDRGGWVTDIDKFDAGFFAISPREAASMDPQQRWLLELSWELFEQIGCRPSSLRGTKTGVYIAASNSDYELLVRQQNLQDITHTGTGTSMAILANRLSYFYGFEGPSLQLDAACASSIVAIHEGIKSLRSGECDQVLVGAIHLMCHPSWNTSLYQSSMLSHDGLCHTFDSRANGYVRGEGAVMMMIKPLLQALNDGDRIEGVIKGSAINHGGKSGGLTVPNPKKQRKLLEEVYRKAGIPVETVTYIEAHGTGTSVGDPMEVLGLTTAFQALQQNTDISLQPWCGLGSIKTNIGHLEPTAGMAGVVKVLMAMQNRQLPPTIQFKELNPKIKLENTPFYIQKELKPWLPGGNCSLLRAGVSSFGFGGVNAHMVMEEYRMPSKAVYHNTEPAIVVLSARNEDRLREQVKNLKGYLEQGGNINLYDIAYTLQMGREAMEERMSIVISDTKELSEQLSKYLQGQPCNCYRGNTKKEKAGFSLEGGAGQVYINYAIKNRETATLAQLWSMGVSINWDFLYGADKPQKISLPGYPFLRERHWIEEKVHISRVVTDDSYLHPLLHTNHSDLYEQKYTSIFTGKEPFFADHLVNGEKILPGVAYIELAREAGFRSSRQKITQLQDIVWECPMFVDRYQQEVRISIYTEEAGMAFEISSVNDSETKFHSRGRLGTQTLSAPSVKDLSAIRSRLTNSKNKQSCYELFGKMGLNYGNSFRGIEVLYYSEQEALAKISLSFEKDYILPPGLMDSVLQSCLGLELDKQDQVLSLPYSINEVNIYKELPESVWSYVCKSAGKEVKGTSRYDINILNETGEVLLSIDGFTMLPPQSSDTNNGLEKTSVLQVYEYGWQEENLTRISATDADQLLILAGGNTELGARLAAGLNTVTKVIKEDDEEVYFKEVLKLVNEKIQAKRTLIITVVCENSQYHQYAFVSGLLKTAGLENPYLKGKILGIEKLSIHHLENIIETIKSENGSLDAEVRYLNGKREIKRPAEVNIENVKQPESRWIKEGGVYLVTGGAGGLGLIFASYISGFRNTRVILVGRSELNKEKYQLLSAMEGVDYRCCDITRKESVAELIGGIKVKYSRLDGIVHSAGNMRDSLLVKKTEEEIREVLLPKIKGLKYLDEATAHEPLDFILLFSSVAAITGNVGQGDYASANAYLDNFAPWRNQQVTAGLRLGRTVSINWPFWAKGGMKIDIEIEKHMQRRWGMVPMPTEKGIKAFEELITCDKEQAVICYGEKNKLRSKLFEEHPIATSIIIQAGIKNEGIREKIKQKITELAASILDLNVKDLSSDVQLGEYGFDSILLTKFVNELNNHFELELLPTVFYNHPTLEDLAGFLEREYGTKLPESYLDMKHDDEIMEKEIHPLQKKEKRQVEALISPGNVYVKNVSNNRDAVAIIGMSCRFPESYDVNQFWHNLVNNKDLIKEVPSERWDWRQYYGDPFDGKTKSKWGGFIKDIDMFDPLFFGLSPREAKLMDPQQRITLEAVYHALEDAGISPASLKNSNTGVFIGVMGFDYASIIQASGIKMVPGYSTGSAHSMLTNRISYFLGLHGPSEPVDTACSSALVAIHRGVQTIRQGDCDMVIVGGVNAMLSPYVTVSISQAGMLSEGSGCKAFGQGADGYVRGEGVGIIVLKSLSKAQADGDRIYGIIRSTAINHGGRANTLTSPNSQAQKELLVSAYRLAGALPHEVSYIEAHGTGTSLGDPVEVEGLKLAFAELNKINGTGENQQGYCGLGSVKANIGHLESAAGIAGVIKVLLSMQYGILPGNPHLGEPNQYLKLEDSPFYLLKESKPWTTVNNCPRIAGVSSFGFGGVNAHMVMEEYRMPSKVVYHNTEPAIVILSARNDDRLREQVKNLKGYLEQGGDRNLYDIAYTLQMGREAMEERMSIVVSDTKELSEQLSKYLQGQSSNCYRGNTKKEKAGFSLEGGAGQVYIDYAIKNRETATLAQLWSMGVSINWDFLYGADKPQKISLPGYPFARERHWVKDPNKEKPASTEDNEEVIKNTNDSRMAKGAGSVIQLDYSEEMTQPQTEDKAFKLESLNDEVAGVDQHYQNGQLQNHVAIKSGPYPEGIKERLLKLLCVVLYIERNQIDEADKFSDLGIDSISGVELVRNINEHFNISMEVTRLYDYPDIHSLSDYICTQLIEGTLISKDFQKCKPASTDQERERKAEWQNQFVVENNEIDKQKINLDFYSEDKNADNGNIPVVDDPIVSDIDSHSHQSFPNHIAVVGMSGRYPGANDLVAFWKNISEGAESISEVPGNRWKIENHYKENGEIYSKWLGVLPDADKFDPLFFRISPAEAELMDPQHRIFLEECWKALEDAAYTGNLLDKVKCGTYVGIVGNEYLQLLNQSGYKHDSVQLLTGNSASIFAARLAYLLNLKGPAIAIDTACSSSLVAVHLACQALKSGEVDMAVAGGVSLYLGVEAHKYLCAAGVLSRSGKCKAFDNNADGMVLGEGAGVVILKRLTDALKNGDNIQGVIIGSGINQDGRTNGIMAPSVNSQAELIKDVYDRYNINAKSITCIEAHGSGTKLGDSIEIEALAKAFEEFAPPKQYCALGSVKTNIGHTSAAAGIAGLHKVLLQMKYGMLVPSLHYNEPNKFLRQSDSPFYVNKLLKPWEAGEDHLRCAAVSSFGFSGTNAHLVVEEFRSPFAPGYQSSDPAIVPISACDEKRLFERLQNLLKYLEQNSSASLFDIAYTLQVGREAMQERFAVIVHTRKELVVQIMNFLEGNENTCYYGKAHREETDEYRKNQEEHPDRKRAIESRDRKLLAQLWIEGQNIEWQLLYKGHCPKKISLPGYPFARETFWYENMETSKDKTYGKKALYPMLQLERTDEDGKVFASYFTDRKCLPAGHSINGLKILSAAGVIEMLCAAGFQALGKPVTELNELNWMNPIIADGQPLKISTRIFERNGVVNYEVFNTKEGAKQFFSQGRINTENQDRPHLINLHELMQRLPGTRNGSDCYNLFSQMGIEYSKDFRGIKHLYYNDQELLSEIHLPAVAGYFLQPGLLDSAIHSAIGFQISQSSQMPMIPVVIGQIKIYGELTEKMLSYVRKQKGSKGSTRTVKLNIDLLTESGEIRVSIRDILFCCSPAKRIENLEGAPEPERNGENYITIDKEENSSVLIESKLKRVFSHLLKLPETKIDVYSTFEGLGVDSLILGRLAKEISKEVGKITAATLFEYPSIHELSAYFLNMEMEGSEPSVKDIEVASVHELNFQGSILTETTPFYNKQKLATSIRLLETITGKNTIDRTADQHLVTLREGKNGPVTFIVPGLPGLCEGYLELAGRIAGSGPVYGLQMKGVADGEKPLEKIKKMAEHNLTVMESVDLRGPINIYAHSYGGTVAYEMLRQMNNKGMKVGDVVFIDSYPFTKGQRFRNNMKYLAIKGFILMLGAYSESIEKDIVRISKYSDENWLKKLYQYLKTKDIHWTTGICQSMGSMFKHSIFLEYSYSKKLPYNLVSITSEVSLEMLPSLNLSEWHEKFREVTRIRSGGSHFSIIKEPFCSKWLSQLAKVEKSAIL